MVALLHPLNQGRQIPIDRAVVVIGRSPECDSVLDFSSKISRMHCALVQVNHLFFIRDLGSMNGVWVDGARVEREHQLTNGMRVAIGDVQFQFYENVQPAAKGPRKGEVAGRKMPAFVDETVTASPNDDVIEIVDEDDICSVDVDVVEIVDDVEVAVEVVDEVIELDDARRFEDPDAIVAQHPGSGYVFPDHMLAEVDDAGVIPAGDEILVVDDVQIADDVHELDDVEIIAAESVSDEIQLVDEVEVVDSFDVIEVIDDVEVVDLCEDDVPHVEVIEFVEDVEVINVIDEVEVVDEVEIIEDVEPEFRPRPRRRRR
ncbi:MAG: FHA domain-containing protein [Planctomycetaceae bacterium]